MDALEQMKFDLMLENHLRYNIFPDMSVMFPMCKEAIQKVNQGEGDAEVSPPKGIKYVGKGVLTASLVVEEYQLEFFLNEDALDPD